MLQIHDFSFYLGHVHPLQKAAVLIETLDEQDELEDVFPCGMNVLEVFHALMSISQTQAPWPQVHKRHFGPNLTIWTQDDKVIQARCFDLLVERLSITGSGREVIGNLHNGPLLLEIFDSLVIYSDKTGLRLENTSTTRETILPLLDGLIGSDVARLGRERLGWLLSGRQLFLLMLMNGIIPVERLETIAGREEDPEYGDCYEVTHALRLPSCDDQPLPVLVCYEVLWNDSIEVAATLDVHGQIIQ